MKPKHFDVIIFDWDGTLMDSTAQIVESIQAACVELGLPEPSKSQASHVIGLGLMDAMREACPVANIQEQALLVQAYQRHYSQDRNKTVLFDDVFSGLEKLKSAGYFMAVATGKGRSGLDHAIEQTQTRGFFDITRTVSECQSKPHPEMIFSICEVLDVSPKRALMVGDTTHDLLMASEAGSFGAALSTGAHNIEQLKTAPFLSLSNSFDEFINWLDEFEQ